MCAGETTLKMMVEMIRKHLLGSDPIPTASLPDADVNGDGKVDLGDINALMAQ